MRKVWLGIAAVLGMAVLAAAAGCDSSGGVRRAATVGERDGLHVRVDLVQAHGIIAAEVLVENRRRTPAFLVPDQCGRVTEAMLVRTKYQPEGRTWPGSLQRLKQLVLERQEQSQAPERLAPRRPGDGSQAVPRCERPRHVVELAPAATVRERWQVDPLFMRTLDAVGSENTKARVEVVEARDAADTELLDVVPAGEADAARAGRRLRLEMSASAVVDHPPKASRSSSSLGQLFDMLLEHGGLRSWLAAQPDSWRSAELMQLNSEIRFSAVTSEYERAVTARARPDGSNVTVRLPGPRDRIRTFESRPATLPSGVRLVREADDWMPTRDVIAGRLALPSGRIVADGFPSGQSEPLEYRVAPGEYPVHVTLARPARRDFEKVALATLVVSDQKPARWRRIGGIGVDGGVAAFTSIEGARALDRVLAGASHPGGYFEQLLHSLAAHDYQVTEAAIEGEMNQVMFSTGSGDGGYPLLVGLDAAGRPVRFVLDFFLIHLAWPGRPAA
jgi:hypothetical protein